MRSKPVYLIFSLLIAFFFTNASAGKVQKKAVAAKVYPVIVEPALQDLLTRAVQSWQAGNASAAYTTLDSINYQELNETNASSKAKAAIWTATYLQAQYKFRQAAIYLDSAMHFSSQYAKAEELKRTYEAYSSYYLATGNAKGAIASMQAATKIKDSISQAATAQTIDSLQKAVEKYRHEAENAVPAESVTDNKNVNAIGTTTIMLGVFVGILLIVILILYGKLQRLRSLPPAPITRKIEKPLPTPTPEKKQESPAGEEIKTSKPETGFPKLEQQAVAHAPNNLTARLSEVELVLIRAEVLSNYGDQKSIKSLLTEYNTQLPLIMKNLDDSITLNENEPIIRSLEYLKPYLSAFGMQSTLVMLKEIEDEAPTSKPTKLLSRVFQVRNHCRRALDESKSLLEKIN
ncbi:MAG TPA: hypothetical protein PLH61_09155 [Bacteroidia bacterium]|jgi:hypothetical protein|nr:hypothetical protein [Bacteroidia bacterium]HQK98177.1 hypothetical protein [Bacteroidia bacterium]